MAHPGAATAPRTVRAAGPVRGAVVAVLVLLATVGFALPAAAHASLIGSDPADGATLATAPARVTLTFDDTLEDLGAVVTVTGPDGAEYQAGDAVVDGVTLSTAVQPLPAAGTYSVAYRVVSDDGHPVEGQLRFALAAAPASTPAGPATSPVTTSGAPTTPAGSTTTASPGAPATGTQNTVTPATVTPASVTNDTGVAAAGSTGGSPVWPWLVVALAVIGAIGAALFLRRRKAAGAPGPDGPQGPDGPPATGR